MLLFKALLGRASADERVLFDILERLSRHSSHQHNHDFKMMTAVDLL